MISYNVEFFDRVNNKDFLSIDAKKDEKIVMDMNIKGAEKTSHETSKQNEHHSLFHILKEHLTNEMYDAILILIETPHLILKIFLGTFLLVAYGFAAYTTIELILSYLQYDVTSTARTIYETPSIFPKVTFCNLNPFTTRTGWNYVKYFYDDSILKNLSYSLKSIEGNIAEMFALNLLATDEMKK